MFTVGNIVTFKKRWEDAWFGQNYTLKVLEVLDQEDLSLLLIDTNTEKCRQLIGQKFIYEASMLDLVYGYDNAALKLFLE